MTRDPLVVCVGGATVDRTYRLAGPLRPGTSNPAAGRTGFGGVARNVAVNLACAGVAVELVSRVGDDEGGRALLAGLDASGVGHGGVAVLPGCATAEYAAVLTPGGELALGLAAMAILDALVPDAIGGYAGLLAAASWVFADCNLPAASLLALAGRRFGGRYRLALDAVSVAKAARLPERLAGVDLLFLNRDEAEALAGRQGGGTSPEGAAEALLRAGAGSVVLTLGIGGALAAAPSGRVRVPAVPARVVDVTGAGDALVAATLRALLGGAALPEAVARGCEAAATIVASPDATLSGRDRATENRVFTKA